jgi:leucyl aminopeptidase (aminopeptidase T)
MHRTVALLLLLLSGTFLFGACSKSTPQASDTTARTSAAATAPGFTPALGSIATKVVGQSAGVHEGEIVELYGSPEDLPLLQEMAVEVRKRGGHPLMLVGDDKTNRRMIDEVPAKYDAQEPRAVLGLVKLIDVFISTEFGEGRTFKGVSPERQAAQARAFQQVFPVMQRRGVRAVTLGNGLYPTDERAEQFGISRQELGRLMYGGVDTDYGQLESTGKRLHDILAGGKELRVTNAAGTDLRMRIAGRPVQVSDGVISAEDRKRGGPALSAWLPAGEVYLTPGAGATEGVLVADRYFYQGDRVEGLRLEIKGGKVVAMSAKSGLDALKARYDAAGPGRDLVSVVDLGINPSIQVPSGSAVNVWSRAGAVTVVVGNNLWAGGTNNADFAIPAEVSNATVSVDGVALVKDGKLVGQTTVTAR